ncbi:Ig-like domain-containing protein [Bacillus coreaensis]
MGEFRKLLTLFIVLQLLFIPTSVFANEVKLVEFPKPELTIKKDMSTDEVTKRLANQELSVNPADYPLLVEADYVYLNDSYNTYHYLFYQGIYESYYDSGEFTLDLTYYSDDMYYKDPLVTLEFYKDNGYSLDYSGYIEFDTYGEDALYLESYLTKSEFDDQRYIYVRLGVSESVYSEYYSDVTLFKVENPYYNQSGDGGGSTPPPSTEEDTYAVISNESVDGYSSQYTGTFSVNEMKYTMDSSLKQEAYKMDAVLPFDFKENEDELVKQQSIPKSYSVGDYKTFWVTNLSTYEDYQISARLAYNGTNSYVWVYNNEITDADANMMGKEFDQNIHPSVTANFGVESDINNDGKVNILCFDIQDGFNGYGGYVGGYFYSRDLSNDYYSNMSETFYIDTYPAMGMSSTKDVTSAFETVAHEFQHMVNFNQNVLVEGGADMDIWLDEALSMASEQVYSGQGLMDRVDYYNMSNSVTNGHSLLYWGHNGDVLSNYSLSYLFGQYIKKQAGIGDRVFKEITMDPNNDYRAVENIVKKYIDPNMTFGQFMTNFRIALLLNEPTGLYGFKNDPFFDSVEKKIYSGSSGYLNGGGAIVTTLSSSEGLEEPYYKGEDITYTYFDMYPSEGGDVTPPSSPSVNAVGDSDTTISGYAEANSTVYAMVGQSEIGRITADIDGSFKMSVAPVSANTKILIYSMDASGNISAPTEITVGDKTAPSAPVVNQVTDQSTVVTGTGEKSAKITVKSGSNSWTGTVTQEGTFSISIPKQKAGTVLEVTATDAAGNVSATAKVTVVDKTAPSAPVVNQVTDQSTVVTGTGEKSAKITVKSGSNSWTGTVTQEGTFSISIPKQKAGTVIEVTATDAAGNVSATAKVTVTTVADKTAPSAPVVNQVTDQSTVVTGTGEKSAKITVKSGSNSWTGTVTQEGTFSIMIPKQKAGTVLEVTATDAAGNVSAVTKAQVLETGLQQLVGKTRYSTAVKVSEEGWSTANTVVLVNGGAIADGLTATPLASANGAPILLTTKDSLPNETLAELQRLKAKKIILIGGTGVISKTVADNLVAKGYTVSRIGGVNRYETSLLIAKEVDKLVDVQKVFMAYGYGEPDALSIAAQAGKEKQPIILTDKQSVPTNTFNWLKGENLDTSYFIGGTGVIKPAILSEMDKITSQSVLNNRLSGSDRQETNAKVIQHFYKESAMQTIMIANSQTAKLVDALSAGPLAAKYNVPVLLVSDKISVSQINVITPYQSPAVHQIGGGINTSVVNQVVELMK